MKTAIKLLIWTYILLLLVEGALRKWVLPDMADELLIVRDPVLLAIYALALGTGMFPTNRFIAALAVLGVLSAMASLLGGHSNFAVIAYGLRINYLHLPLIWIMGRALNRRNVEHIGAFLLVMAIPMSLIMVQQFNAPMTAWINRGVGNDEVGQLFGAEGRIRPPGLFAFITGPQLFFPLCAAFFFDEISGAKRLPWYLLIACGLAIALALPLSISRTVMLSTGLVAVAFVFTLPFTSKRFATLWRPLLLLGLVGAGLSQLPVFSQGLGVFMSRWDSTANVSDGSVWTNVMDRTVNGFTNPYYFIQMAPFLGHGIGTGSNVGARLTSGEVGFLLAEEEWGKVLLELGPVLGAAFIILRLILAVWLGLQAWRALRENHNALPLLIFTATAMTILQGQWAPPTVLGFAVIGSGLMLGALNPAENGKTPAAPASTQKSSRGFSSLPEVSDRRPQAVLK